MHHSPSLIIPAIIPTSLEDLQLHIDALPFSVAEIQIDLVDGIFAPFVSWPYGMQDFSMSQILTELTRRFVVEVDLMVDDVEVRIPWCIAHGVQKIVVHLEAGDTAVSCITRYADEGCVFGLSANNSTPYEVVRAAITPEVSYIQCMGIATVGTQGQPFDVSVCDRLRALRADFPDMPLGVDGAMSMDTIPRVREAGATRFVVGSALFSEVRHTHDAGDRARMVHDAYDRLDMRVR